MSACEHPLVVHRVKTADGPGGWDRLLTKKVFECPDPQCSAEVGDHGVEIPCRWSWPLAHGKAHNGTPFPERRCPGCLHIRRAGKPEEQFLTG